MRRTVLLISLAALGCATADPGSGSPDGGAPGSDAVPAGTLTLTSPNGGETFTGGSTVTISWSHDGTVGTVNIELHAGGSKVADVITGAANLGTFMWIVPLDLAHGDDYTLVIRDSAVPSISDSSNATFTISNWRHWRLIALTVSSSQTDYPILIELTPTTFNYAGAAANGNDLRFATSQARSGGFDVPHYIESWNPSGTSRVWIRMPALTPGGPNDLFVFYGNPYVTSTSDMNATLPDQFVSTDGQTLSTSYDVDVFRVQAGHTVYLPPGSSVTVTARWIDIAGTIDGVGRGYGGGSNGPGGGSGGGGSSTTAGAGGGGHGGIGGIGGYDSGDSPGSGGGTNGGTSTVSIGMGSGGGGTDSSDGGAGGGAITLRGRYLSMSGTIRVDGTTGTVSGRCGGGGAGGGVLLVGYIVDATGTLSARGGDGADGAIAANDGGGGGGGGRLKIFYQDRVTNDAAMDVAGGEGGLYGGFAATSGGIGTTWVGTTSTGEPAYAIGSEQSLF